MEISSAQVVFPAEPFAETLAWFTDRLGFAIESIWPADGPRVAVVTGHGLRIRLDRSSTSPPGELLLHTDDTSEPAELTGPNGTVARFEPARLPLTIPPLAPTFVITGAPANGDGWGVGRAGMRYRDLIPDRQGGRFIASHIHIPTAGPVPDYVHYHHIRFQLIFVRSGWVRVVYEDQGEPFVMEAGDCVLQPPLIRHRVLESSENLEVVEIGCPAEHQTFADPGLELPNATLDPDRDFGDQCFVRHRAAEAVWTPWRRPGFEVRNSGIDEATNGLASVEVIRPLPAADRDPTVAAHDGELLFYFVLAGSVGLVVDEPTRLESGEAVTLPAGQRYGFGDPSIDLELLEVRLPAW
ncbi:MAG: cupin [Actinomycetia bacterium]|nr:cupin [Actinomycetes bacterium]